MKKTSLFLVGLVSLLLIGGSLLAWIWFLRQQQSTSANPTDTSFLGDFPGSGTLSGGIFGNSLGTNIQTTPQGSTNADILTKPVLLKIYAEPTAGLIPYETDENATRVRFVDKATGDVLEYTHETKNTARVIRETIPRVLSATFSTDGRTVYRQYVDDAGTLVTVRTPLTNTGEGIRSTPLPNGTLYVAPLQQAEFVLVHTANGTSLIRTEQKDESESLWSSGLFGWNVSFAGDTILIYQNPSYDIPGVVYTFNSTSNTVGIPFASVRGFVPLPHPKQNSVLFSRSGGNVTSLFVHNLSDHTEQALAVRTLANKCVWSLLQKDTAFCAVPKSIPQRDIPDAWYRGEVAFADDWYKVNTQTGKSTLLYDTQENSSTIDVEKPMLNSNETALFFINKEDESLWMLSIPAQTEKPLTETP